MVNNQQNAKRDINNAAGNITINNYNEINRVSSIIADVVNYLYQTKLKTHCHLR